MSSINDENELKKCLEEIIELINKTIIEENCFTNENNIFNSNKQILDKLTNIINEKLKNSLGLLSEQFRYYFLDLFKDYNYSYEKGIFNESIKKYILKQLLNDLSAIKDSFDAFQAAFNGNLLIVKDFIEKYPKFKDKSGIWGTTLLYSSSRNNHIDIVKYLIEQGHCNINAQNKEYYSDNNQLNPTSGSTSLHVASYYGHLNIVKYLIDNGADYFIQNHLKETSIDNGLLRDNIKEFYQDYLIFTYQNLNHFIPESTILNDNRIILDSIWEYKPIHSDQWNSFDDNQLQQSLISQLNQNYYQDLNIKINNQYYSFSIIQFLCTDKSNKDYLWIRCRGSSIQNFNFYSKWQIMFQKHSHPIKIHKALDVFNIDDNSNVKIKIKSNYWYNANNYLNQQLDNVMNYRKKYLNIYLPFINDDLFIFNLKTFSFYNNDKTIQGFIRWIPIFISNNDYTIIDNFQTLNSINLIPKFRTYSNNYTTDQLTTTCTNQIHHIVSSNSNFITKLN